MVDIFLSCIPGIPNIRVSSTKDASTRQLIAQLNDKLPESVARRAVIARTDGSPIFKYATVADLANEADFVNLQLRIPLCGGKGGFGSMLKSQGNRMSRMKNKTVSKDNYKNVDGIRIGDLKKLQKINEYLKRLPEEQKQKILAKKEKLSKVINSYENLKNGKDIKFDDTKFLEDYDAALDDIRDTFDTNESEMSEEGSDFESDWDSEDENEDSDEDKQDNSETSTSSNEKQPKNEKKPKFASFFDE